MVDKSSAPAFSLGTSQRKSLISNVNPGPGSYENLSTIKSPKSFSKVNKQQRFHKYETLAPGPGAYDNKNKSHGPTAVMFSRNKELKPENIPGPGNYEPNYRKVVHQSSGYKLGNAEKLPDPTKPKVKLPGPGQYQTAKSTLLGLNQAAQFNPADRKLKFSIQPTTTPAPNTYTQAGMYSSYMKNDPKISFAKSQRSFSTNNLLPAPNNYQIQSQFEASKKKSKGFSLGAKTGSSIDLKKQGIPGPGTYEHENMEKLKMSNPSFSISKSTKLKFQREKEIKETPGPNTYESKITSIEHKSFSIGKDQRKTFDNKNKVPGPGNYEIKPQSNLPSWSVSKSLRKSMANENQYQPGPGNYEPKMLYTSQYDSIKIGNDHRRTFEDKRDFPGPGTYTMEPKIHGGNMFGHESRLPEGKESFKKNPGPGNYTLPTTVSNLPQYTGVKQK